MHANHSASLGEHLDRRLAEAWQGLWDSFVDPRESLWDDAGGWVSLGGGAHGLPASKIPFTNEQQLREIRDQCRALAVENEFAINGHENRISFLVGAGHTYRATAHKGRDAAPELWQATQEVLDAFVFDNHWHRRQQEIVRRYDRDGEVFLRFFATSEGQTRLRFVEPSQVATPQALAGEAAATFGILTDADDVETPRAYYIDGQPVDACHVQHRRANVDFNVKRGLPLFYPVRKNLRRAEKLLRNMTTVAEIQSAIALVRKHRGATRSSVEQFVAGQTDATIGTSGGQTASFRRFAPGTILDSHGGIEYDFPTAALDAASYVQVLQAELRAIASRLVMPEFMLTSDASNANYSSTMMAEGPAMRMFARMQAELVNDDLVVMWRVIDNAVDAGRLPREVLDTVEIQAVPPSLEVRDALKEAQAHRIELAAGILSPQTWSQRRGLDYDQEQANLRQHAGHSLGGLPHPPHGRDQQPRGATEQGTLEMCGNLSEAQWDPSIHPRGAYSQNRGWFSPTSGAGATSDSDPGKEPRPGDEPPRSRHPSFDASLDRGQIPRPQDEKADTQVVMQKAPSAKDPKQAATSPAAPLMPVTIYFDLNPATTPPSVRNPAFLRAVAREMEEGLKAAGIPADIKLVPTPRPSTKPQGFNKSVEYNHDVRFDNSDKAQTARPVLATTPGAGDTKIFSKVLTNRMPSVNPKDFANILLHEVFYHGVLGASDDPAAPAGDLKNTVRPNVGRYKIDPSTRDRINASLKRK